MRVTAYRQIPRHATGRKYRHGLAAIAPKISSQREREIFPTMQTSYDKPFTFINFYTRAFSTLLRVNFIIYANRRDFETRVRRFPINLGNPSGNLLCFLKQMLQQKEHLATRQEWGETFCWKRTCFDRSESSSRGIYP